MLRRARRFIADQSGVAGIEYALILGGIGTIFGSTLYLVFALSLVLFKNVTATLVPITTH